MPADQASTIRAHRKSAFSCEACRKRKVKCDGVSPTCSRCKSRGDHCVYGLTPTLSYTQALEKRVAELEALLGESDAANRSQGFHIEQQRDTSPLSSRASPLRQMSSPESDVDLIPRFEGLKMQGNGRTTFHGATSFFQLSNAKPNLYSSSSSILSMDPQCREKLINSAWRERTFEQYRQINEPFKYLLESYWCWIYPLCNFLYRPAFTRDFALGPYFSTALYNAMLSQSLRGCKDDPHVKDVLCPYQDGVQFFHAATAEVFEDLRKGANSIPIVQTLLTLSVEHCDRGDTSQAWLYSGIAFRLVEDMGIYVDARKYAGSVKLSDEEIEIRNRLFWSCYIWEKILCLYLGRTPIIRSSPVSPPHTMLDDTAEIEPWTPHGIDYPDGKQYPAQPAHSISCFMQMCRLSEILNELLHIYDPLREFAKFGAQSRLEELGIRLEEIWAHIPQFLKLQPTDLPDFCPPSHIVTLNSLYYTIKILLHRPLLGSSVRTPVENEGLDPKHVMQCMFSANAIIAIFDLYRRTFGESHVSVCLLYGIYTAASMFLTELRAMKNIVSALEKIRFCLQVLERLKISSPILMSAFQLIRRELEALGISALEPAADLVPPQDNLTSFQLGIQEIDCVLEDFPEERYGPIDPSLAPAHWGSCFNPNQFMPIGSNLSNTSQTAEAVTFTEPHKANFRATLTSWIVKQLAKHLIGGFCD